MTQEQLKMRVIKTLGLVLAGAAVLWAIWLFGVRGSLVAGLDPGAARGVEFFAALGITFLALLAPAAQLLNMIVKDRSGLETEVEKTTFLYRMIVEKSNDIILEIDEKGDVAFANPAVILLGYEPEKLIGRPVKQLIPEKDRQEILPIITTRRTTREAPVNLTARSSAPRASSRLSIATRAGSACTLAPMRHGHCPVAAGGAAADCRGAPRPPAARPAARPREWMLT